MALTKNLQKFKEQLKTRRIELGYTQQDMLMKSGLSRQQYNNIENNGNPTLQTLLLVAEGLNCELKLVPKEQLSKKTDAIKSFEELVAEDYSQDPWQGLLD